MIRPAEPADRDAFHDIARAYIAESGQRREYSEENTQAVLEMCLGGDNGALLLVAESGNGLAGGLIAYLDQAFTEQPVCLVSMFYVRPEYRGTGLARALMEGVCRWADDCDCSHTFASGQAMIGETETQMFVNLARKFDFQPAGSPVLARRKP